MKTFRLLAVCAAIVFAQVTLLPLVEVRHAVPDLLIVVVAFTALHASVEVSASLAWVAGAMQDCLSVDPIGTHAAVCLGAALLLSLLRRWVFREDLLPVMLAVGLVAGLACAAHGAALALGGASPSARIVLSRAGVVAAYTALACPFLYRPLCRYRRTFGLHRPVTS